ncbi:MAG: NTP transferase domain-containing protein [Rhodobiaceae bacterium]|nr:molybdopterin-binding/glycosyltransferase family 2 protein [Rhodobiaceae bacterium]MCC0055849.1 NTP transferase domain-containing protein [Rhodobiaceae bacterium]
MKFGPVPTDEAAGTILAHGLSAGSLRLKKGTRLQAEHVAALREAGIAEITVARLDAGDLGEDEAAALLAKGAAGIGIRVDAAATGRVNLFAEHDGMFVPDTDAINAMNRIDPGITIATLPAFRKVVAGEMVATIKIIPYAVPGEAVSRAGDAGGRCLEVRRWQSVRAALIQTAGDGTQDKVLDKTRRVTEERLKGSGSALVGEWRVPHEATAVAGAIAEARNKNADFFLLFGLSAISDEDDVIPRALREAGGEVVHFGMPVDPGNLLMLGILDGMPVLGAPGCARSPRENGFDWVLERLLAGLTVTANDVTGMGVGGLLMEIVSRPQPREVGAGGGVAAIVLAAGRSSRMEGGFKLTERLHGETLAGHAVRAALQGGADEVIVVTGHRADDVRRAVKGFNVRTVHNDSYESGLSSSLRAGVMAVPDGFAGALVMLSDMPGVTAPLVSSMIATFREAPTRVTVPVRDGRRGNPVLFPVRLFPALSALEGDTGARRLVDAESEVNEVAAADDGIFLDIDTPAALAAARGE